MHLKETRKHILIIFTTKNTPYTIAYALEAWFLF